MKAININSGVLLLTLLLPGCGNSVEKRESAAVIVNPTAESRAELERIIAAALNRVSIILADDALTLDSELIIDRKAPQNLQNNWVMGRRIEKPHRFYLKTEDKNCFLVQESNNNRWLLKNAQCVVK